MVSRYPTSFSHLLQDGTDLSSPGGPQMTRLDPTPTI